MNTKAHCKGCGVEILPLCKSETEVRHYHCSACGASFSTYVRKDGWMDYTDNAPGMQCTWCDREDDEATRPFVCDECIDHMEVHRAGHHDHDVLDCPLCAAVRYVMPQPADLTRIMHARHDARLRVCVDMPHVIGFEVDRHPFWEC